MLMRTSACTIAPPPTFLPWICQNLRMQTGTRRRSDGSTTGPGMDRDKAIESIAGYRGYWDVVIIGGGATGLGTAVDAAAARLPHAAARAERLRQGHLQPQHQAGPRRRPLPPAGQPLAGARGAPRARPAAATTPRTWCTTSPFIVPIYDWWEGPFYGIGLKVYDRLAGQLGLAPSRLLSREETLERIPTLEPDGLRGGVHLLRRPVRRRAAGRSTWRRPRPTHGAVLLNYMRGRSAAQDAAAPIAGVAAEDLETGSGARDPRPGRDQRHRRRSPTQCGGWTTPAPADAHAQPGRRTSCSTARFLPGDTAIMVPQTDDGRVLFAIPWHGRVVVGTTDTPVAERALEPRAAAGGDRLHPRATPPRYLAATRPAPTC